MRLLMAIIAMIFTFGHLGHAQDSTANCSKELPEAREELRKKCDEADLEFDECTSKVEQCRDAQQYASADRCSTNVYQQCGAPPGEIQRVAQNKAAEADRAQDRADEAKGDQSGALDKVMDSLKEKSQADEDFAKTKRDIEKEQIDAERDHKKELNDIRGQIAQRLKDANEKDIDLSNEQLNFLERKIEGSKSVRESILAVQATCREAKRKFERDFIERTRVLANSSDPGLRGQLRASSISEASTLESRVKAERDALYDQCMADGEEAIQESRTANQEIERVVQERLAQLDRSKEVNRQFKEQMDQADQQNVTDSMETLIRGTSLRQGQVQDAETVRQNKHQNADTGMALAMAQAGSGALGGLGGGGGGDPADRAQQQANDANNCAEELRSVASTAPSVDLRRIIPKYNKWSKISNRCEPDYESDSGQSEAVGESGGFE